MQHWQNLTQRRKGAEAFNWLFLCASAPLREAFWLLFVLIFALSASAAEPIKSFVGVTRQGTPIPCILSPENGELATTKTRVLMIGTTGNTKRLVERAVQWFHASAEARSLRE